MVIPVEYLGQQLTGIALTLLPPYCKRLTLVSNHDIRIPPMSLPDLQTRTSPSVGGAGAPPGLAPPDHPVSGSRLLALDAWQGAAAAERRLAGAAPLAWLDADHLDQAVAHILAPLG